MTTVVPLKTKRRPVTNEDRVAIEAAIKKLAERYGPCTVATVAHLFVAAVIERALARNRPTETAWVADMRARLERAMKG